MSTGTPRDADALMRQLQARLDATVKQVVPWFIEQMPEPYFLDTDEPTRLAHLMALVAARASSDSTRLKIESQDGSEVTFIEGQDRPGLLADLVNDLPKDRALTTAKVHTARDDGLVLDVFHFGDQARFDATEPSQAAKLKATLQYARSQGRTDIDASLQEALQGAGADYVRTVPPLRLFENHLLWMQVQGTEDTVVNLSSQGRPGQLRISIATGNADARSLFERVVTLLGRHGVDIVRAFLDPFEPESGPPVTVLGLVVTESTCPTGDAWKPLATQLTRLRWLDARALRLHALQQDLALWEAETLVALCDLSHARLARDDAFAYARTRLLRTVRQHLPIARRVAQLFAARNRVSPAMSDEAFAAEFATVSAQIAGEVDRLLDRNVLSTMLHAVQCTLRTNLNLPERYGLALRLDPAFFARKDRPQDPYGVFFVHGRGFDGFHVRFADIARGGVRVVRPRSSEQHELEAERVFEEAYDLAFAQQLKNKDIPEGGSKAVVLAEPQASVDMCVKAFANSLLDLLTPEPGVQSRVLDRFGAPELLYLGPDENISPEHIVWIVERARARGYPLADAFMSSKPGAGINHKEFGVTSEGVTVFLEEALKSVGIDPRTQPFTVKLTGGPDGDVAGNEIRILYREFGDHAKIVAIADGSGSAQDPNGLDRQELMRLVEHSLPIADFKPETLGEQGRVLSVATPEGLRTRNTLCFEAKADAFVPAGGRPQTIHAGNWSQFLDASGQPTSRVIVEGANLFITPEARTALAKQAQVVVVKDSSANKCGVICSSYEIAASMMLSPQEFLKVKPVFVAQVLDRLRVLARREAQLLFREYARTADTTLPKLSVTVSETILRATEAIREGLPTMSSQARAQLDDLVVAHLPPVLIEQYSDRIERLPLRYREHIIASSLATELVYREGVAFLDVPEPQIAALAVAYLDSVRTAQELADRVAQSDLPEREQIATLLRAGGGRAGLNASR